MFAPRAYDWDVYIESQHRVYPLCKLRDASLRGGKLFVPSQRSRASLNLGFRSTRFACIGKQVLAGGDVYSLRITNRDGQSIVLAPGQARSLGDFDIYLWMAVYPVEGQTALSGIDAHTATNEIAIVRRVFH